MFTNLKITAYMSNHTAVGEHLRLDCILSAAKAKEILKDNYFLNSKQTSEKEIIVKTLSEFLKYDSESGIFHASCGIGNGKEFATSYSKRWNSADDELVKFSGKGKQIIDTSRGFFKSYHNTIITKAYREIVFYAVGDKEEIERLLNENISYLGKKSSQGFGKIKQWKISEIENDISCIRSGKAMRFLPVEKFKNKVSSEYSRYASLIPPAWRNDCIELCYIPDWSIC